MKNLFQPNVDTSNVDNLVAGTLAQEKVIAVNVTGTGIVKRGTTLSSADGINYVVSATNIQAVLLNDADTDDPDEAVQAASFGGEFNQNVIETVMGSPLTALAIHEARGRQIFIAPMNAAPEVF